MLLELILIIYFSRKIREKATQKRINAKKHITILVVLWVVIYTLVFVFGSKIKYLQEHHYLLIFPAVGISLLVTLFYMKYINRLPTKSIPYQEKIYLKVK